MPDDSARWTGTVGRRGVLGVALLIPACSSPAPPPVPPAPLPVDPDVALRRAAVDRELALLRAYDAALDSLPALAATLAAVRAEHTVHLAALEPAAGPGSDPTPPVPTPPVPTTPVPATPASRRAAVRALSAQERRAAAEHARDAAAASRDLAVVLASLAASESAHLLTLT